MLTATLYGLALLPAACFFGIAVYTWVAPCYDKRTGRAFVEWFQAIDPHLKAGAKWAPLLQLALTLPLLAFTTGWPLVLVCGSLGLSVAMLVPAVRGNLPLDRRMPGWDPTDRPPEWERVRDRWLRVHSRRGVMATGAFVLLLAAALNHDGRTWWAARTVEGAAGLEPAGWRTEATVLLPLADNSGRAFPDATWDQALAGLVTPFGGGTLGEPQEGCWVDDRGRLVREWVRPVVISFPPADAETFRNALRRLRHDLAQEAVYVRYAEARIELIR